jgi:hypothetical protein
MPMLTLGSLPFGIDSEDFKFLSAGIEIDRWAGRADCRSQRSTTSVLKQDWAGPASSPAVGALQYTQKN